MEAQRKKQIFRGLVVVTTLALLTTLIMGLQWATYARLPLPDSLAALENDGLVTITTEPWLTFTPTENPDSTGLIFYPGGRIDPRGYSSIMREIAEAGHLVVVPAFPFNMAVFDANEADEIIVYYPEIEHWVIAGHSVGGTMAAQYADENRDVVDGMMIWASYPAPNIKLADSNLPIVVIYGSEDPAANDIQINESKSLLPAKTQYVKIEGGDHHQFGSYIIEPDEHHALISKEAQHNQIISTTLELFRSILTNP